MAKFKAFTDIEQSKKLAEILPIESADMSYRPYREEGGIPDYQVTLCPCQFASWIGVPCWSLAALLELIPHLTIVRDGNGWYGETEEGRIVGYAGNTIDACVEIIHKLKEKDLI